MKCEKRSKRTSGNWKTENKKQKTESRDGKLEFGIGNLEMVWSIIPGAFGDWLDLLLVFVRDARI
jgi:hypothetical protein